MTEEPAFPVVTPQWCIIKHPGLTKLEYLSSMCLQGMLSNSAAGVSIDMANTYAKKSVLLAKSLISELEKENK